MKACATVWAQRPTKYTLEAIEACNSKSILDLGCGTGSHAIEIALSGREVVGVDKNEAYLNFAEHKVKSLIYSKEKFVKEVLKRAKQFPKSTFFSEIAGNLKDCAYVPGDDESNESYIRKLPFKENLNIDFIVGDIFDKDLKDFSKEADTFLLFRTLGHLSRKKANIFFEKILNELSINDYLLLEEAIEGGVSLTNNNEVSFDPEVHGSGLSLKEVDEMHPTSWSDGHHSRADASVSKISRKYVHYSLSDILKLCGFEGVENLSEKLEEKINKSARKSVFEHLVCTSGLCAYKTPTSIPRAYLYAVKKVKDNEIELKEIVRKYKANPILP